VRDCAVLVAIGGLPSGNRWVLGVSVSLSEAEVHWRDFLQSSTFTKTPHQRSRRGPKPTSLKVCRSCNFPQEHRKRMRTTNMLERQNKEVKRRTGVATLFPNEASLLRLVTAVLVELSDDWETGKMKYLVFQH
jgi:transposase-like protein